MCTGTSVWASEWAQWSKQCRKNKCVNGKKQTRQWTSENLITLSSDFLVSQITNHSLSSINQRKRFSCAKSKMCPRSFWRPFARAYMRLCMCLYACVFVSFLLILVIAAHYFGGAFARVCMCVCVSVFCYRSSSRHRYLINFSGGIVYVCACVWFR